MISCHKPSLIMNAYEKLRSEMDAEQLTVDWKAKCTELDAENTALKGTIKEYVHKVRDLEKIVRLLLYRKSIDTLDWKNIASIDHMFLGQIQPRNISRFTTGNPYVSA